ncbi:hypothetical protein BGZ63DRAFT_367610 [Mariannaea sp. PMI_226]|nr:hypothetical protein BGZ63DRAFT_367610 [Mariannaea sp. PMI_226]
MTTIVPADKSLPPATDLPLGVIFLAIFILALICHIMFVPYYELDGNMCPTGDAGAAEYGTISSNVSEMNDDDDLEVMMLDQVAPARTRKQWKAETNDVAIIASGFDIWWAPRGYLLNSIF